MLGFILVAPERLERSTLGLEVLCSIQLSYGAALIINRGDYIMNSKVYVIFELT